MRIPFTKYQGTGNDFVIIDNRDGLFPKDDRRTIERLCDRRFGIGADGLMLIEDHGELDFRMVYFNSDGSQSLCGNGSRCAVSFAHSLALISTETTFETTDGTHDASIDHEVVHFQLRDITSVERKGAEFFIENGSPHHIRFVENVDDVDIITEGRQIRYAEEYAPEGTNINFVQLGNPLRVRTYERGVEQETLSCGTGVTAVAIAASFLGYESPVPISTKGGDLAVSFQKEGARFTQVVLSGPAKKVYTGEIEI